MERQKIMNLLNDSSSEESKFATKTWYVIDRQRKKRVNRNKVTLLNLKEKLLNQVFVIILMHLF